MRFSTASIAAFVLSSTSFVAAQTYTDCDPLQKSMYCLIDFLLSSTTADFKQHVQRTPHLGRRRHLTSLKALRQILPLLELPRTTAME